MFQTTVVEKINFMFNRAVYDNVEKYDGVRQATDDNRIWGMRIACSITKVTHKYSEYLILTDVLRQKCLLESVSVLCYTYTICLVR